MKSAKPLIILAVLLGACLCWQDAAAQRRQVHTLTGHVYEASTNEPLVGVGVMQKASNVGSITGDDGAYVLGVTDVKGQIVASCIGFKTQTIDIDGRSIIDIYLEPDTESIEDAVVVAYGTQKKATVTGALTVVNAKELSYQATTNLANALGGVVAGIVSRQTSGEPGYDGANILIRGYGTWANAAPLVLIDGIERNINDVNADEIESFSMLKDASATAVYGMKGANGVILINTKKGHVGKPKITFKSEVSNMHGLRFQNFIRADEFALLMNEASRVSGNPIPWSDEDIQMFRMVGSGYTDGVSEYLYPNVNWTDAILKKNAFQTINEISVSGGNEIVRYYANLNFSSQSGLFKEDPSYDYRTNSLAQRYTFRSNVDVSLTKNLTFELSLLQVVHDRTYPGTSSGDIFNSLNLITPLSYPIRNPDGSLGGSTTSYERDSPYRLATNNGYAKQIRNLSSSTAGLKWDLGPTITPGLSLDAKFSYDFYYYNEAFRRKTPDIKKYIGPDPVTGEDRYTIIAEESAMGYSLAQDSYRTYYYEARLNYNRTFNRHSVGALAMFNRRDYKNLTAGNSTANLPFRRQGWAGRLTYNFDQRYLAEFNFGYNGSENFARGLRYGFFPAGSVGWVISNEKWWKVPVINHLKIRGSYGLVGNDSNSADRFFYLSTVNTNANGYYFGDNQVYHGGTAELSMGSPNATWEVSHKADVGIDLEMFKGKLKLTADYFHEYRDKILIKRTLIPDIMGAAWGDTPWANIGIMQNQGFDMNFEFQNTTGYGLFYSVRANVTFARNKIIEDDTVYHTYAYQDSRGRSAGALYGYIALGMFQSQEEIDNSPVQELGTYTVGDVKYKDLNEDGFINAYDQTYIGYRRTPELMGGLGFSLGYKGFFLTVNFTGAALTNILFNSTAMWPFSLEYPSYNVLREYYDNRFIPGADNSGAKYPVVHAGTSANNYHTSTLYMRDASYLKLKTFEFGYNFPKKWFSRTLLQSVRLYINGNNVFSIDGLGIVDPEANNLNSASYPTQRVMTFGVQLGF